MLVNAKIKGDRYMKKVLKLLMLSGVVTMTAVGLSACADNDGTADKTPKTPQVTQIENNVFQWYDVENADSYVMIVSGDNILSETEGVPGEITESIDTISTEVQQIVNSYNTTYTYSVQQFVLDTEDWEEGDYEVRFAAVCGKNVSEYSKSFTVIVDDQLNPLSAPDIYGIDSGIIRIRTYTQQKCTLEVTFANADGTITVSKEIPANYSTVQILLDDLLGDNKLTDGANYVVTAVLKCDGQTSDASDVYTYTHSEAKTLAKPVVIEEGGNVAISLEVQSYSSGLYTLQIDGVNQTIRVNNASEVLYLSDLELSENQIKAILNGDGKVDIRVRTEYVSGYEGTSEWSDTFEYTLPAGYAESLIKSSVTCNLSSDKTAVTVSSALSFLQIKATLNGTALAGSEYSTATVYPLESVDGTNKLVVTAVLNGKEYVVYENEYTYTETVYSGRITNLDVNGTTLSWRCDKADKYVVKVYTNDGTVAEEYETDIKSFDFDEIAQVSSGMDKYTVTVCSVTDDVRRGECQPITLYRMAAPSGHILERFNDIEISNYGDVFDLDVKTDSDSFTIAAGYSISQTITKTLGLHNITLRYAGDDNDILDSLPATYEYKVAQTLEYSYSDGENLIIYDCDADDLYLNNKKIETKYYSVSGNDLKIKLLDYMDNYGATRVSFCTIGSMTQGSLVRVEYPTTLAISRQTAPDIYTVKETDEMQWDIGEQGLYEVEILDINGDPVKTKTVSTYGNVDGGKFNFVNEGITQSGKYTFRVRRLGSGDKPFNSVWKQAEYVIFEEISYYTDNSMNYSSMVVDYQPYAKVSYSFRIVGSTTTQSGTATFSALKDTARITMPTSSSYSYNYCDLSLVPSDTSIYYQSKSVTINIDKVTVDYFNSSIADRTYYVEDGDELPEACRTPELYISGSMSTICAMTKTTQGNDCTYRSVYTNSSYTEVNGKNYYRITLNDNAVTGGYLFNVSSFRSSGNYTNRAVDYVIMQEGTEVLAYLESLLPLKEGYYYGTTSGEVADMSDALNADTLAQNGLTIYIKPVVTTTA